MASTTMGRPSDTANRRLYWGIAIAVILVLAIAWAMRSTRNEMGATSGTSVSDTGTANTAAETNMQATGTTGIMNTTTGNDASATGTTGGTTGTGTTTSPTTNQ